MSPGPNGTGTDERTAMIIVTLEEAKMIDQALAAHRAELTAGETAAGTNQAAKRAATAVFDGLTNRIALLLRVFTIRAELETAEHDLAQAMPPANGMRLAQETLTRSCAPTGKQ